VQLFSQDERNGYKSNPNYARELDLYDIYKIEQADIVMLGNSLTHGVNWNELLGRNDVVERGISGDVTEGIINRMDNVILLKPKVCFIMAGLNDIYNWIPVEDIYVNYTHIVNVLKTKNIIPVIQSTLYAGSEWGKDWNLTSETNAERNRQVDKLNNLLRDYASRNNIMFIDINSRMRNANFLKSSYTYDGVHLNAKGYKLWGKEVEKALKKLNL
jgi:lysophospholipase L1-like esterase